MHKTIESLQAEYDYPTRKVDIIRKALEELKARKDHPEQPAIFSDEQCKLFYQYEDKIDDFLETEDAQDIILVLVDTFKAFVTPPEPVVEVEEPEEVVDPKPK